MQITNEMVRIAFECFEGSPMYEDRPQAMRRALEAVAPMIAKAENEACAKLAAWEIARGDRFLQAFGPVDEDDDRIKAWSCGVEDHARAIFAAIRARHATPTDSIPQEK